MTTNENERIVRCRMLDKRGNQCTAEAVSPDAEILVCTRHLGQAYRLVIEAQTDTDAA